MQLTDSHIHFWDTERLDYPWLAGLPPINRPRTPDILDTGGHDVDAYVFVQADCMDHQSLAEVSWVNQLAETAPIGAIVAHAPVEQGAGVDAHLAALADEPRVVGVRRLIQGQPTGFATTPQFVEGVQALAGHDLSFDLCVTHDQLGEATQLVAQCPQVKFVLDHLGKPDVAEGRLEPWRADLAALAEQPNVAVKLSGLTTEADPEQWTYAHVEPYLQHALDTFGPSRCMFGSDWPVATLATSYGRWADTVATATADLSTAERDQVFTGTAQRVYRL